LASEKVLEEKRKQVEELSGKLKESCNGIIVEYSGITVSDDTALRKSLREAGSHYKVVKNTLLKLALKEAGIEGLDSYLEGSTAIATNDKDYSASAKILKEYSKKNEKFKIKAGFIDGAACDEKSIDMLAEMPSKETLYAQVVYGLNSPIQGFANVLQGSLRSLVIALNAVAEKAAVNQ
jgi:large subunit ribosomal protein L10